MHGVSEREPLVLSGTRQRGAPCRKVGKQTAIRIEDMGAGGSVDVKRKTLASVRRESILLLHYVFVTILPDIWFHADETWEFIDIAEKSNRLRYDEIRAAGEDSELCMRCSSEYLMQSMDCYHDLLNSLHFDIWATNDEL